MRSFGSWLPPRRKVQRAKAELSLLCLLTGLVILARQILMVHLCRWMDAHNQAAASSARYGKESEPRGLTIDMRTEVHTRLGTLLMPP